MDNYLNKISRSDFLKKIWGLIFLPYIILLIAMVSKNKQVRSKSKVSVQTDPNQHIIFDKDIILVKNPSGWKAFSSRCTHLGCQINQIENDQLICPCHGSAFDLEGNVLRGPSVKPLKELQITDQSPIGKLTIEL